MKTGLVLSGGGIKGIAHVGTLKAISEYGIKINEISGTSAGAIVGALYAAGHSWKDILEFYDSTTIFEIGKYAFGKPGFIDTIKFEKDLRTYLPDNSFEKLNIPITITATAIQTGTTKAFHKGELIASVLASSAFPGVFTPVEIEGVYYFDGGVIDDFPVEYLLDSCDYIIGSYTNPLSDITVDSLKHSYQVLNRAYEINLHHQAYQKIHHCNLLISPPELSKYGTFSMRSVNQIFELGYQEAKSILKSYPE